MPGAGGLVITVEENDADVARECAADVADAIAGMLASPQSPIGADLVVAVLDSAWVEAGEVDAEELKRHEPFSSPFAAAPLYDLAEHPGRVEPILDRLDGVLSDGDRGKVGLIPALVFWRMAVGDYAFAPEDVRWAIVGRAGNRSPS